MTFYLNDNLWQVMYVNPGNEQLKNSDGAYTLGVCDNNQKTIFINNSLPPEKEEHVLCHEITHSVCFEYDIVLPIEAEERLCNFLADHGREIISILDELLWVIKYKIA